MVRRMAGKCDGVKDDRSCRAKSLGGNGQVAALQQYAAQHQAQAGRKAQGDAKLRGNEIAVERILDEESHSQKEGETAQPGEKLYSHELFPIDPRSPTGRSRFGSPAHF